MEINKRKNLIKYALGVFLSFIMIFGVIIATRQINRITSKEKDNLKAEVEQQTSVPEGYTGIYTADDLKNISNDLTANYILMANIDMSGEILEPIGLTYGSAFTGIFDGNLYTISNLSIESENQYVGMFGYVNGGTIKNLTIENETIKNNYKEYYVYTGGLAGYNSGTIENVKVSGELITTASSHVNAGGVVGYNSGTIINSNSNANVTTTTSSTVRSGGLVGYSYSGTITNSYATGNVISKSTTTFIYSGGLIGDSTGGQITNVYSTGTVNVEAAGGESKIGGLIGNNSTSSTTGKTINNVYSISNIEGNVEEGKIGGLIGYIYNANHLNNGYAIGKINVTGTTVTTGGLVGGKNGYNAINSYWSTETTGQLTSITGTSKLFQSMLYKSSYTDWDFDTVWQIEEGKTLPYLLDMTKPEAVNKSGYTFIEYEGVGVEENPLLIKTAEQLQGIKNDLGAYYKLANNIEWDSSKTFEPIGTYSTQFTGTLDGSNFKITNLNIESENQYVGLFGYINGGKIKNVTLENETVKNNYTTNATYSGGLAGYVTAGTIDNVKIIGTSIITSDTEISYYKYIGGLVGYAYTGTTITNSSSNLNIDVTKSKSSVYLGGLVGYAYTGTTISDSSSSGDITATTSSYIYAGGLVGSNSGTITNAYSTGNIVTTTSSYNYSGGLIGTNSGAITNAYSTGSITATSTASQIYIGGLIGYNTGAITSAYSTGIINVDSINGDNRVGGLIGNHSTSSTTATISNVFTTSPIEGSIEQGSVGGLIGYIYNANCLTNGYAVGKINVTGTSVTIGGLVGSRNSYVSTNSYWSPETTGQLTSITGTSKLFKVMLYKETYIDWDFDTVWQIEEGETLPYLLNMEKPESVSKNGYTYLDYEGEGTEENPFIIKTPEQLQGIKNDLEKYYKLGNDIEWDNTKIFEPIGSNIVEFKGNLDGNNFKVSNLKIESENQYVGMFGYINGGTIKNLTLENITVTSNYTSSYPYIGELVGYLYTGIIENVKTIGDNFVTIETGATYGIYIGGLVGYANTGAIITNSNSTANITVTATVGVNAGGLIGYITGGTITSSNSSGNINIETTSGVASGGLIGSSISTEVRGSYSKVNSTLETKSSSITAGGLIGALSAGSLTSCYSTGDIITDTTNYEYVGGLIGSINNRANSTIYKMTIEKIYSTGNIKIGSKEETTSAKYIGGLIGIVSNGASKVSNYNMNINQAYSTGSIETAIVSTAETNNVYIAGLIGYAAVPTIEKNTYYSNNNINIDETYATTKIILNDGYAAGLIGYAMTSGYTSTAYDREYYNRTTVTNSYWSPEATGQGDSRGGTPRLLQSMLKQNTYTDWDFETVWQIEEGETLPYFKDLEKPEKVSKTEYTYTVYEGEGTEQNPYLIRTPKELQEIRCELDKHYKIVNDINMLGFEWDEIGKSATYSFAGILDGGNYTVSNLNVESENLYVGMFGYVNGGTIKNLVLENEVITSANSPASTSTTGYYTCYVGGLAGYLANATIENIEITGTSSIKGETTENSFRIGGLAGYTTSTTIKNSNMLGEVTANTSSRYIDIGGLIGYASQTTMESCSSTKNVTAASESGEINAGGLIGEANESTLTSCYSTGNVITETAGTIYSGGLVGESYTGTSISTSRATGDIKATTTTGYIYSGGLVGRNYGQAINKSYSIGDIKATSTTGYIYSGGLAGYSSGVISDAYTTGAVESISTSGYIYSGGLIGSNSSTITNTYVIGKVTTETTGTTNVGGLIGYGSSATVTNSYWSEKSTGQATSVKGTSKTIQELLYQDAYENWDFDTIWTIEPNGESLAYLRELERPDSVLKEEVIYETKITVLKTDTEGNPLEGASFIVKNEAGETVREGQSKSNGKYIIGDLETGIYTLTETKAPTSYIKDSNEYRFYFAEDGKIYDIETEMEIGNPEIKNEQMKIEILNRDIETKDPIKGSEIGLFDEDGNAILGIDGREVKGTTDENGKVTFTKFVPGTYKYKQISVPTGYRINPTIYTVTITEDGIVTFGEENNGIIENEKIRLNATVTKKDYETDEPLQDVQIGLYDANKAQILDEEGNHIVKITNEEGQVTFENLEVGTYYYKEMEALEGYALDSTMYKFTVNQDETITYYTNDGVIYNKVKTGTILIRKRVFDRNLRISGVVFGLYYEDGSKVLDEYGNHRKAVTNKYGYAIFTGLEKGTYKYRELSTPGRYYIYTRMLTAIVNDDYSVTFVEGNNGIVYNKRIKYSISFGGLGYYSGKNVIIYDSEGREVSRKKVGKNGKLTFTDLESGNYYYKIEGDDTSYSFGINEDGSITSTGNGPATIYTAGNPVDVTVRHPSGTSGAIIRLYDSEGNVMYDTNGDPIYGTTNGNGEVIFTGLLPGTYIYKIDGDDTEYTFTVREDGKISYNGGSYDTPANVVITTYVSGIIIGLYYEDGTPVTDGSGKHITGTTGSDGTVIFSGIYTGDYYYKQEEVPAGYIKNENTYNFTVDEDGNVTYGDNNGIMTNERVTTGVTVSKIWADNENNAGKRPTELVLKVMNGDEEVGRITVNEENNWSHTFTLYKYTENSELITYTVEEEEINVGDLRYYTSSINGTTITNTFTVPKETVSYTVNKVWVDTDAQKDKRPASIKVQILGNGQVVQEQEIPNTQAELTFNNLPKYDSNGNEITYTVSEAEVNSGDLKFYTSNISGNTITNTFTLPDEKVSCIINKVWVDTEVQKDKRPASIKVQILGNGQVVQEQEIPNTQSDVTFNNLPKYDSNGNEITYTVAEAEVNEGDLKYYVSSINGNTITNTFTKPVEKISYTINKVWIDTEAQKDKRPTSIILQVKKGEEVVSEKEVTANSGWTHTFTNLPKYDADGREIVYTAGEISNSKFYISSINGNTITNTFRVPDEKVSITVNKIWVDTEEQAVNRPANIKVQILENGQVVQEKEMPNTQAEVTFNDLPKYDSNGNEIAYTIAEAEVNIGDLQHYTSSIEGTTITNTFIKPLITANVGVLKYETGTTTTIVGAVIGLFDEQGNIIRDTDGNQIKYETKEDGLAIFMNLKPGVYKYKELQAPVGYILNDTMYEFTVNDEGVVSFGSNNGIIYNDKVVIEQVKGNVTILKLEKDTQRILPGATIGLFDEEGQPITNDNKEIQLVTNEEGKVTFENLLPGTYKYKELQAPKGYVLNNKVYEFTVNEDGTVVYGENNGIIYNEKLIIEVDVEIKKLDKETNDALKGAIIGLFDSNGNMLKDEEGKQIKLETDEKGKVVFKALKPGTYNYKELQAPNGYILEDKLYTFIIDEEGRVQFIENSGVIYNEKVKEENNNQVNDEQTNNQIEELPTFLPQTGETLAGIMLLTITIIITLYCGIKFRKY